MSPLILNTTWLQSSLKHFFSHVWTLFEYLSNKVIQFLIPVYLSVFLIHVSLFEMFAQIQTRFQLFSSMWILWDFLVLPRVFHTCLHVSIISKRRSSSFILLLKKLSTSCVHRTKSAGKSSSYAICAKKLFKKVILRMRFPIALSNVTKVNKLTLS